MTTAPPRPSSITDTQQAALQLYREAHNAIEDGTIDSWSYDPSFKWTWSAPSLETVREMLAAVDRFIMLNPQRTWALNHLDIDADAPIGLGERMGDSALLCFAQRLDRVFRDGEAREAQERQERVALLEAPIWADMNYNEVIF